MQKIVTQVPGNKSVHCGALHSTALLGWREATKRVCLVIRPAQCLQSLNSSPIVGMCLGRKGSISFISVPHTWLGVSSVLALKDVAGETRILVLGWEGSRRGAPGHQASPELENPPGGTYRVHRISELRVCTEYETTHRCIYMITSPLSSS